MRSKIKPPSEPGSAKNHTSGASHSILPSNLLTTTRTATLAVMLDHAFGIFNNVPPRFQWAEIDLAFPSGDAFFQISNYDTMVAQAAAPLRRMKMKDAFVILFSTDGPEGNLRALGGGNLTALDMQMLIHCSFRLPSLAPPSSAQHQLTPTSPLHPRLLLPLPQSPLLAPRHQHRLAHRPLPNRALQLAARVGRDQVPSR